MIAELRALASPRHIVRIAPELDVPLTPRVTRLLDTTPLRRLSRLSQLGLVSLVYPGATHSRLEHSLGVYRCALQFLQHFAADERFCRHVDDAAVQTFVLAALLHDVGHWPFCHPIEDMRLPHLPRHETLARQWIENSEIAQCISQQWTSIDAVCELLAGPHETPTMRLLASLLSGPIDIDKLDYLRRDSLHAGVPYGQNFDSNRLISALQVHPQHPRLAIGDKGRTAAEMMVFSRYIMFSEVYWHHAVRSATAMLQRAVYLLQAELDLVAMMQLDDHHWIARLCDVARSTSAEALTTGLFGQRRVLWKRVAEFDQLRHPELHRLIARRPYPWLVACSKILAEELTRSLGVSLGTADVIIDAPPVKLEVDINIDVVTSAEQVCPLGDISPVVDALANRQFDDVVKRVRVFVRPDVRQRLPDGSLPPAWLESAVRQTEQDAWTQ